MGRAHSGTTRRGGKPPLSWCGAHAKAGCRKHFPSQARITKLSALHAAKRLTASFQGSFPDLLWWMATHVHASCPSSLRDCRCCCCCHWREALPCSGPYYQWWNYEDGVYHGLEETIDYICRQLAVHQPIHGIMGFSQGSMLTMAILGMKNQVWGTAGSVSPLNVAKG